MLRASYRGGGRYLRKMTFATRYTFLVLLSVVLAPRDGVCREASVGNERLVVRTVRIEGVSVIPEATVRSRMSVRPKRVMTTSALRRDIGQILELYRKAGHWQAAVMPSMTALVMASRSTFGSQPQSAREAESS